jgi:hypothetical protein
MNVFAPGDLPSNARVFDGHGWKECNKEDTAMLMAQGVADDLVAAVNNNKVARYSRGHFRVGQGGC